MPQWQMLQTRHDGTTIWTSWIELSTAGARRQLEEFAPLTLVRMSLLRCIQFMGNHINLAMNRYECSMVSYNIYHHWPVSSFAERQPISSLVYVLWPSDILGSKSHLGQIPQVVLVIGALLLVRRMCFFRWNSSNESGSGSNWLKTNRLNLFHLLYLLHLFLCQLNAFSYTYSTVTRNIEQKRWKGEIGERVILNGNLNHSYVDGVWLLLVHCVCTSSFNCSRPCSSSTGVAQSRTGSRTGCMDWT